MIQHLCVEDVSEEELDPIRIRIRIAISLQYLVVGEPVFSYFCKADTHFVIRRCSVEIKLIDHSNVQFSPFYLRVLNVF